MDETFKLDSTADEAVEVRKSISRMIAEIDALREEMRREHQEIQETSHQTARNLVEIGEILADLRAA